jgi:acyl-CoA synthetase (AMP-forming)/AMP-acid ligase II
MADDDTLSRHPGIYAERTPDRPAVVMVGLDGQTAHTLTFAEFEALSNQCAHLLRQAGLERGDGLAVFMENNLYYTALVWGGLRAGLRLTAIATHLTPSEVDYILSDSGASALMTSKRKGDVAKHLKMVSIQSSRAFMLGGVEAGFGDLDAALAAQPKEPIPDQYEGVEMLYSSGTTGRPKGVRKTLPQQAFGIPPLGHRRAMELYGLGEDTVYLSPAPLYHAAPLGYNLRTLRAGGTTVVMEKFDAEQALALIERYRVTHAQWVPTHFVRLLRLPDETRLKYDHSSLKCAIHAAAPCPVPVKQAMIDWWGPIINEYYGGSEGNGMTAINTEEWLCHPGSVGRAVIGKIRICDDGGNEVPVGSEGTIFFEDGPVFEYHNDAEKTAQSRNDQGWSTLGDIGYVDDDGFLYLTDRRAFVIISGGVNIYPQEAENLLANHPQVLDVAVIGVPNEEFGEEVKAVVQLVEPGSAAPELEAELIAYCRAHLSAVKCPRSVDFVEALPRHENGKLYKRKLRDTYWP